MWGAATVMFRLLGQYLLNPQALFPSLFTFVLAVPLIAACTFPAYRLRQLTGQQTLAASILTALPGMVLDIITVTYHDTFFPNLSDEMIPLFSAWLLWAYALILLSGIPGMLKKPKAA